MEEGIHSYQREFHKEKNGRQENKWHFPRNSKQFGIVGATGTWRAVISTAITIEWCHIMKDFEGWADKSFFSHQNNLAS